MVSSNPELKPPGNQNSRKLKKKIHTQRVFLKHIFLLKLLILKNTRDPTYYLFYYRAHLRTYYPSNYIRPAV